jgi:hypothetical protein
MNITRNLYNRKLQYGLIAFSSPHYFDSCIVLWLGIVSDHYHSKISDDTMHFSLSLLFLSTIAFCSPVPQVLPTAQDVTQSVINIHNAVLELDATVQAFQGGSFETAIVEGKEVLAGVAKIHTVNREGFRRATLALPPFSVEDTIKFIDTVVATGWLSQSFQHGQSPNFMHSGCQHPECYQASSRKRARVQGKRLLGYCHRQSGIVGVRSRYLQCGSCEELQSRYRQGQVG